MLSLVMTLQSTSIPVITLNSVHPQLLSSLDTCSKSVRHSQLLSSLDTCSKSVRAELSIQCNVT